MKKIIPVLFLGLMLSNASQISAKKTDSSNPSSTTSTTTVEVISPDVSYTPYQSTQTLYKMAGSGGADVKWGGLEQEGLAYPDFIITSDNKFYTPAESGTLLGYINSSNITGVPGGTVASWLDAGALTAWNASSTLGRLDEINSNYYQTKNVVDQAHGTFKDGYFIKGSNTQGGDWNWGAAKRNPITTDIAVYTPVYGSQITNTCDVVQIITEKATVPLTPEDSTTIATYNTLQKIATMTKNGVTTYYNNVTETDALSSSPQQGYVYLGKYNQYVNFTNPDESKIIAPKYVYGSSSLSESGYNKAKNTLSWATDETGTSTTSITLCVTQ